MALVLGVALCLPARAAEVAAPAQVILIRHAEKPAEGNDLSPRGFQRARALVSFFQTNPAVTRFGPPAAIYAAKPKADGAQARPLETVQPLAKALRLAVNTDFRKDDVAGLAASVMKDSAHAGKTVLVAWQHHLIPRIAKALGAAQAPDSWPGEVFDRAWIIDFDGRGKPVSFRNIPQRLLPGDSGK